MYEKIAVAGAQTSKEQVQEYYPNKCSHSDQAAAAATDTAIQPAAQQPEAIAIDTSPEAAKPADVHVSGPIVALPAVHQLDMSVLDSLPATMRLELMREYGMHSFGAHRPVISKPTPSKAKVSAAGGGRGTGGGLEGSLRRIKEAGKSKSKAKPPPFRSIFAAPEVQEVKNAASMKRPAAQTGYTRMQHQTGCQQVRLDCCCRTSVHVHVFQLVR